MQQSLAGNGHEALFPPRAASGNPPAVAVPTEPTVSRLGDLLGDWQAFAERAHESYATGRPRGPVTGLPTLDRELGNLLEPGLHIAHGDPGTGKTAFALQVAATCGCPALFVSCEMSPLELFRRHTARVTETYLGKFKTGELEPSASLLLARRAAAAAPGLVLADATLAFATQRWIRDAALAVRGDSPHLLIVVDSVHSWIDAAPGDAPEYEALNAGLTGLRALAGALSCPILAVAERNRASMKRGGLSAGAGSRKIEYGATTVLDLARDLERSADLSGEVDVDLRIAKNRNGVAGKKVALKFHGALQRFREDQ